MRRQVVVVLPDGARCTVFPAQLRWGCRIGSGFVLKGECMSRNVIGVDVGGADLILIDEDARSSRDEEIGPGERLAKSSRACA
jgi:hypothetical protein